MPRNADAAMDRLFEVAVLLSDRMNQRLAEHGLTPARAEVVCLLHRRGRLTQRELSQALECTPRNVTGLVDALETGGFVTRAAHPTDRRAVLVSLTKRGEALVTDWESEREHGAAQIFGAASTADLDTFVALLDRVASTLRPARTERRHSLASRDPG